MWPMRGEYKKCGGWKRAIRPGRRRACCCGTRLEGRGARLLGERLERGLGWSVSEPNGFEGSFFERGADRGLGLRFAALLSKKTLARFDAVAVEGSWMRL
jgi:hypothetical protein